MKSLLKGANMFTFAIGLVLITMGVTFMYILPPYIISVLNGTGIFTDASLASATTAIGQVQGVGFAVIMIGLVFMIVSVVSGRKQ